MDSLQENQSRLTIIVPFHKIEGTEEFFRWIPEITNFQDIKVIVVIDSNDKTLIHKLSHLKNENVFVKVDPVGAPGLARNSALSEINSQYLMFVDSDDYIYLDEIHKLINLPEQHPIIIASYEKMNLVTREVKFYKCPISTIELAIEPALWRFIIMVSEIENFRFTKYRMAEDQIFLAELFSSTKKVHSVGNVIYRYSEYGDGQISKAPEAMSELQKAIGYLDTKPKLIHSEYGRLVHAKLILALRFRALRKIATCNSFAKDVFKILFEVLRRKKTAVPDPTFQLTWYVNV